MTAREFRDHAELSVHERLALLESRQDEDRDALAELYEGLRNARGMQEFDQSALDSLRDRIDASEADLVEVVARHVNGLLDERLVAPTVEVDDHALTTLAARLEWIEGWIEADRALTRTQHQLVLRDVTQAADKGGDRVGQGGERHGDGLVGAARLDEAVDLLRQVVKLSLDAGEGVHERPVVGHAASCSSVCETSEGTRAAGSTSPDPAARRDAPPGATGTEARRRLDREYQHLRLLVTDGDISGRQALAELKRYADAALAVKSAADTSGAGRDVPVVAQQDGDRVGDAHPVGDVDALDLDPRPRPTADRLVDPVHKGRQVLVGIKVDRELSDEESSLGCHEAPPCSSVCETSEDTAAAGSASPDPAADRATEAGTRDVVDLFRDVNARLDQVADETLEQLWALLLQADRLLQRLGRDLQGLSYSTDNGTQVHVVRQSSAGPERVVEFREQQASGDERLAHFRICERGAVQAPLGVTLSVGDDVGGVVMVASESHDAAPSSIGSGTSEGTTRTCPPSHDPDTADPGHSH